nr:hypothetical protein [Tanacetum cinerariifolium]
MASMGSSPCLNTRTVRPESSWENSACCGCSVETDKVIHIVETDIVKFVVEVESFGMSSDDFDKETVSFDELQLKQANLSCVHALSKLHLHEIHVVPKMDGAFVTSWRLLFIIPSLNVTKLIRFTHDDDLIVEVDTGRQMLHPLQVYERPSQEFHNVGIEVDGEVVVVALSELIVLMALQEAHDEESCLEEQMLNLMHRFVDRFTRRRPEFNRLKSLPDHPLIDYGRYALGRMTGPYMRNATTLKIARDELLRSMEEKAEFIKNHKEI